jgi:hypothetical protein
LGVVTVSVLVQNHGSAENRGLGAKKIRVFLATRGSSRFSDQQHSTERLPPISRNNKRKSVLVCEQVPFPVTTGTLDDESAGIVAESIAIAGQM